MTVRPIGLVATWVLLSLVPTALLAQAPATDANTVEAKPVTFAEARQVIQSHKGKVILVDFWADYCVPCKKNFPNLVTFYKQHAAEGLMVVTVNLDDPTDAAARAKALKFLQDKNATFTNLVLGPKERDTEWFSRLKFDSIPAAFVYNRQGELEKRFADPYQPAEVEKLVEQLLKQK